MEVYKKVGGQAVHIGTLGGEGGGASDARVDAIEQIANAASGNASEAIAKANQALADADAADGKASAASVATEALAAKVEHEQTGLAATKAIADSAKEVAEAALPKAGGEMSGGIAFEENLLLEYVGGAQFDAISVPFGEKQKARLVASINNDEVQGLSLNLEVRKPDGNLHYPQIGIRHDTATGEAWATIYPGTPASAVSNEIVVASWARSHFIEQPDASRIRAITATATALPSGGTWLCIGANAANVAIKAGGAVPGFVCNAIRIA